MHIKNYVGILMDTELQLSEAFTIIAARHDRDSEIREGSSTMATWARRRLETVRELAERFGEVSSSDADKLRSALFAGSRVGGFGLLRDLHDVGVLAQENKLTWLVLRQAFSELHERRLEEKMRVIAEEVEQQIAWIDSHIKAAAPQALTGNAPLSSELKASIPKHLSAAALPDPLWAPVAGAASLLVIALVSFWSGHLMLLPSLGPTAYLIAEMPAHPASRFYNIVVGHLVALGAAFIALTMCNAWVEPEPMLTGILTWGRLWASVIAVFLTILIAYLLKASHPPASATTLLLSLGGISSGLQVTFLIIGVLMLAVLGAALRRVRLVHWKTRIAMRARMQADAAYSLASPSTRLPSAK